ncbi:calmodulin-binding protein 60 A isoform X1 [Coffea arabica]|uniref:Calmodulin-binding protein 60 A isoform X1 n=1 Tax=Coffea arabica TaxID=13443 RepID=A0A6P6XFE0_COFAR|nr:calmodulin-binding protein 60 A-like isoform X1 [Coffea arabica]
MVGFSCLPQQLPSSLLLVLFETAHEFSTGVRCYCLELTELASGLLLFFGLEGLEKCPRSDNSSSKKRVARLNQMVMTLPLMTRGENSLLLIASELITLRRMQKLIEPALEPMIRKIVKEEVDLAMKKYLISIRRTCGKEICPSESGSLQLQFLSGISLPVFTGTRIEGEDFNNLQVALVDPFTGQVVSIGPQSAAKAEIVVLEGDFDGDESDNWTFEEFKNNIVREREGKKPLLTGDAFLTLKEGIGVVSDISFTDNSSWTRSRKFRLGARVVDNSDGNRVKEAKTDSFIVRDHRGELYKKHHPPSLADEVWRLEKIGKDGAFHRRLSKERIKTVKDFLTLYFVDPARLRNILGTGMSTKMWEVTVDHARTCVLDKELHFYYPSGSQHKKGVVFNVVGEVMGFVSDCQYITHDKLSETEMAYARDLVAAAYRHWTDVVSIDDEASLMDGSLFLSTIEYSSNPPMLDGSKVLNSHKSSKCDYPEPTACSDIMPSMYSLGGLTNLDEYDLPIMDSMEVRFDHPLNIPGQVTNNTICDTDSMTQAFYEDEHLQFFDSSNLGPSTGLNTAVSCFLGRPKRRWKMLFSVLRWFSIRRLVARKSKVKEVKRYC